MDATKPRCELHAALHQVASNRQRILPPAASLPLLELAASRRSMGPAAGGAHRRASRLHDRGEELRRPPR